MVKPVKPQKRYSFVKWMVRLSERVKLHVESIQIFYERNNKEELVRFFGGTCLSGLGMLFILDAVISVSHKSLILGTLGAIAGFYFWDTAILVSA